MNDRLPIIIRFLGFLGGLLGGGFIGAIFLILCIMVSGTNLGFDSIWPGAQVGAVWGGLLGFFSPIIGMVLANFLKNFTP